MTAEAPPRDTRDTPVVAEVTGTGIPIRGNDIDTDQIVPARFLKVVTFEGLGECAFFDQRYDDDQPTDHPMNHPRYQDATIMVVNGNFGCGSSREHAPQALHRWGIDALIGESFAEIFAGNCLTLGIPTVRAPPEQVRTLQDWIETTPAGRIDLDVEEQVVTYGTDRSRDETASDHVASFDVTIDEGQHTALIEGSWDTTALMRANREAVERTASSLPYVDGRDRE